jgi:hypothetical protein
VRLIWKKMVYFLFFLVQKEGIVQEINYTTQTLRGMQAPETSSNINIWSSLGGLPRTCKSREFKVRLKLANQLADLFSSCQV